MKTPIKLFHKKNQVATITTYFYETPWASGKVVFKENSLYEKMININIMNNFEFTLEDQNLTDEEEDALYEEKLKELSLTREDLELDREGDWTIKPEDEEEIKIYMVSFEDDGFIAWRF